MEKLLYQLFGVPLVSEIKLPLLKAVETFDSEVEPIVVQFSEDSFQLREVLHAKPFTQFSETEFIYCVPSQIEFYVRDGKEIWVNHQGSSLEDNLLYFFSNALPAAFFQRNLFLFHASGVVVEGKVVLFLAPSRTGKSSLALQLQQMGYPVFTDDNVLLTVENGQCMARAGYPSMKAWDQTLKEIEGADQLETFALHTQTDKKGLFIPVDISQKVLPVQQIVFLKEEGSDLVFRPISSMEIMQKLIENTYRVAWIQPMRKGAAQFKFVSEIVPLLKGFEAIRSKNKKTFKEFAAGIISEIFTNP